MKIRGDGGTCLVSADDRLREPGFARWMQEEIATRSGRERLLQAPEGPCAFLCVPTGTFQRRGLAASGFRFARAAPLVRGPPQLERVSSLVLSPPVPVQGRTSSSCLSYFCFLVVLPLGQDARPAVLFSFLLVQLGRLMPVRLLVMAFYTPISIEQRCRKRKREREGTLS